MDLSTHALIKLAKMRAAIPGGRQLVRSNPKGGAALDYTKINTPVPKNPVNTLNYSGGTVTSSRSKTSAKKKDMPHFTDQDRPEKVKDIYRALKREHPDMPAEMKARIAARQGKPGKQHQGPPYKAPVKSWKEKKSSYSKLAELSVSYFKMFKNAATTSQNKVDMTVPATLGGLGVGAAGLYGLGKGVSNIAGKGMDAVSGAANSIGEGIGSLKDSAAEALHRFRVPEADLGAADLGSILKTDASSMIPKSVSEAVSKAIDMPEGAIPLSSFIPDVAETAANFIP